MTTTAETRDRRVDVMAAALQLFEARTFHGTPMPLVAAHAGVGAGTIYRYFDSKETLVNEVYRQWKTTMAARLLVVDAQASGRAGFEAYWSALVGFAIDEPIAFSFLETHRHQPYLDAASHELTRHIDASVEDFVRRQQAASEIRSAPPAEIVAVVLGVLVGLVRAGTTGTVTVTRESLLSLGPHVWAAISA